MATASTISRAEPYDDHAAQEYKARCTCMASNPHMYRSDLPCVGTATEGDRYQHNLTSAISNRPTVAVGRLAPGDTGTRFLRPSFVCAPAAPWLDLRQAGRISAEALLGENIDAETGTQRSNTDGGNVADGGHFGIILSLSNEATTGSPLCRRRSSWRSFR